MAERLYTGFHAVEEKIRSVADAGVHAGKNAGKSGDAHSGMQIFYSKPGPRIKKILSLAKAASISCSQCDDEQLDSMVKVLPALARDHRGIVLKVSGEAPQATNIVDFEQWVSAIKKGTGDAVTSKAVSENAVASESAASPSETEAASVVEAAKKTVVILDSVTDPHNVGAIIRSADQFGVDLVIIPERRGQSEVSDNDVIARSSAGSSAWVPVAIVKNLVRSVQLLKEAGFWVYGADAGGDSVQNLKFSEKTALIMGSEGSGMARLLKEQCDTIVSIPTCGKIDSLNVSVAAGVLLYEIHRQALVSAT